MALIQPKNGPNRVLIIEHQEQKISPNMKKLIHTFHLIDSFRHLSPDAKTFSRYYSTSSSQVGASRIDRMYHNGEIEVSKADYVAVSFSDHLSLITAYNFPDSFSRLITPK